MRVPIAILVVLALAPHVASAQSIELGGTIAAGCQGSEGNLCDGMHPLIGAHASWWIADRIEIGVRGAHLGLPSFRYRTIGDPASELTVTDRSRRFASVLFLYHFRRGSAVRPMLGLGSGRYTDARRAMCAGPGCDPAFVGALGDQRESNIDAIFIVGLSGKVRDRWVWRGGWQAHRFGNEEGSSEELFVGLGYRFGRS